MLKRPIWNAVETKLFYTAAHLCMKIRSESTNNDLFWVKAFLKYLECAPNCKTRLQFKKITISNIWHSTPISTFDVLFKWHEPDISQNTIYLILHLAHYPLDTSYICKCYLKMNQIVNIYFQMWRMQSDLSNGKIISSTSGITWSNTSTRCHSYISYLSTCSLV